MGPRWWRQDLQAQDCHNRLNDKKRNRLDLKVRRSQKFFDGPVKSRSAFHKNLNSYQVIEHGCERSKIIDVLSGQDRKAQRRTFGQIHICRKPFELKHFHLLRNHRFLKIFQNFLQPSFFWIDNL